MRESKPDSTDAQNGFMRFEQSCFNNIARSVLTQASFPQNRAQWCRNTYRNALVVSVLTNLATILIILSIITK